MEELTVEMVEERASKAATRLVEEIKAFNQKYSGPAPFWNPDAILPTFTFVFARLLSDRYVVVPGKP